MERKGLTCEAIVDLSDEMESAICCLSLCQPPQMDATLEEETKEEEREWSLFGYLESQ